MKALGLWYLGFVAITEPKRSCTFYEKQLGLEFVSEDPFALVFEAAGTRIRLQKLAQLKPQGFTILGWEVEDIAQTVVELKERGVAMERFEGMEQDTLGVWAALGGAKVAWFKDPEAICSLFPSIEKENETRRDFAILR